MRKQRGILHFEKNHVFPNRICQSVIFLLFHFMHFLCKVVISYMVSALLIFINFKKGYSSLKEFNLNKHSSYFLIPKLLDFSSIEKWSLLALLLEGVLQQLVNCFQEASGGSLTFRHRLNINYKKSVC